MVRGEVRGNGGVVVRGEKIALNYISDEMISCREERVIKEVIGRLLVQGRRRGWKVERWRIRKMRR